MKSTLHALALVVLAFFSLSLQLQINDVRRANEISVAVAPTMLSDEGPFISLDNELKDYSKTVELDSPEQESLLAMEVAQSGTLASAEPVDFIDPDNLPLNYGLNEGTRSIGSDLFPDDISIYQRHDIDARNIGRYLDPISADL